MTRAGLEALLVVQEVDTGLDRVAARRRSLPERATRNAFRSRLAELDAARAARQSERDGLATTQAGLERQLDTADERDRQITARLRTVSVPREAEALQAEQRALAVRKGGLEDEIYGLLEAIETLDGVQALDDQARAELDAGLAAAEGDLAEVERALVAEEAELRAQRDGAVVVVDDALLARYEYLRDRMGGVGVARLDGTRCLGCYLTLSTSELEQLRREPDDAVTTCVQCGRLLVR